jgi:hypothetical protein
VKRNNYIATVLAVGLALLEEKFKALTQVSEKGRIIVIFHPAKEMEDYLAL